jgi:predicted small metal-binding protein
LHRISKKVAGEVRIVPSFKCRNIGKQCRFEIDADTEDQVMQAALEHLEKVHNMETIPPETIVRIKKAIKQ